MVEVPHAPLAASMDRALQQLAILSGADAVGTLDGNELLMERAWLSGAQFTSGRSTNGTSRLLETGDGVIAVTLARPDDWALLPAWLELDDFRPLDGSDSAWGHLARALRRRSTARLMDQGRTLGLALAATGQHRETLTPDFSNLFEPPATPAEIRRPPRILDLSALWAGPLCSHLLALCGAEVIKVESLHRPDGARAGHTGFYARLNQGKRSVALNLQQPAGVRSLIELIRTADVVIESSRPRALRQLGVDADALLEADASLIWLSLTGHGRAEPRANWTAFGDDAGVAAGLSDLMFDATGSWQFAADAIADPLTGAHAALAAWQALRRGQAGLIELALADVAAWCLSQEQSAAGLFELKAACRLWWSAVEHQPPPACYAGREVRAPVADLGADTEAVLSALPPPC